MPGYHASLVCLGRSMPCSLSPPDGYHASLVCLATMPVWYAWLPCQSSMPGQVSALFLVAAGWLEPLVAVCTHARTHAHTNVHARTHARTNERTIERTHKRTHARTNERARTHARTRVHARAHANLRMRDALSCQPTRRGCVITPPHAN